MEESQAEVVEDAVIVSEREAPPEAEASTELSVREEQEAIATLFGSNDPEVIVERMTKVANHFNRVIREQDLTTNISGKEHVQVEGWQTVGSMMGVFAVKDGDVQELPWPDPPPAFIKAEQDRGKAFGFKASYNAQTLSGAVVGSGEASCSRTESKWRSKEDHAVRSMAQTRARSQALAGALRFIVTMAGYESTPSEEMDEREGASGPQYGPAHDTRPESIERFARACVYLVGTADNAAELRALIERDAGYVPSIAARAILHAARIVRDMREAGDNNEEKEPEGGSVNNDG